MHRSGNSGVFLNEATRIFILIVAADHAANGAEPSSCPSRSIQRDRRLTPDAVAAAGQTSE